MRYQDFVVRQTHKALDDICRAAQAVPDDKADWAPGGDARSALNQMQEIATAGRWFLPVVADRAVPSFDEHARRESAALRQSYDTIAKCVQAARESTSALCMAIAVYPDDQLEDEIALPFGGGTTMTMAEVLALHAWNMVYHLGQINQIQLMLGDREMH